MEDSVRQTNHASLFPTTYLLSGYKDTIKFKNGKTGTVTS